MGTEAVKPKRKPRRNFAEELARVIQYCKMAIDIYRPMASTDADGTPVGLTFLGRIDAYRDILRLMGENGDKP